MEVHFTSDQEARLTQMAQRNGTGAEELVRDAALRLLSRRRYTAAELAQQCSETPLSDEDLAWLDAPPVGREVL
jgi:SOS response regulatory protein OraA/RecX